MTEHTLKQVQEICEKLGASRLRLMPNDAPKYLTGQATPRWVAVLAMDGAVVTGLGATMDEAFERVVARAEDVRRFG